MDQSAIIDGLLIFIGFIVINTFHEFGHAWMASKCGDDTARSQGRVSLNPIVHIDPIGSIVLPLIMIFFSGAGRFLVGWAKPTPVNISNLRNPRLDDLLVTFAGPWMNIILALILIGIAKIGQLAGSHATTETCTSMAGLSLFLFFFNMLPIPPLDGSRIARVILGMSYETYGQIARFGFIAIIVVIQIPAVTTFLAASTGNALSIMCGWFGVSQI